ncbi:MAG: LysR family transcriptional regulator [Nevskia sp.]|nr:LysR family transcriptional regulator [Nevskia sp.]
MTSCLDPRRLETFRVVADVGQISAAARHLNLSQPAVTAQVRLLEAQAGKPLFTRHAGGMRLTEAGSDLLGYARRIHDLLEEAGAHAAQEGRAGGELHLAASTTIAAHIMPLLFRGYLDQRSPRSLRLEVGNTEEVLAWVREGRVPVGMAEGLARAPGVSMDPFLQDELVAVRSTDGPAHLAAIRSCAGLAQAALIWREEGSGTRAVVERAFQRVHLRRGPREGDLVLSDTEAIKTSVLAGLGIGFLSRWSIQRELMHQELEVIPLPDLTIQRTFSWIHGGGGLSGEAQTFLRWARGHPPTLRY